MGGNVFIQTRPKEDNNFDVYSLDPSSLQPSSCNPRAFFFLPRKLAKTAEHSKSGAPPNLTCTAVGPVAMPVD